MKTNLPTWDLTHLYSSIKAVELKDDLSTAKELAQNFAKAYQGKLATLDGKGFAASLEAYEQMEDILGRVISYAQLQYSSDNTDAAIGQFYQNMQEEITDLSSLILFYTLEINKLEDEVLEGFFKEEAAAKYRPWVMDVRVHRPYQLSEEMERLLHEKSVSGKRAWNRLFDETMAGLRFPLQGKEVTISDVLDKMSSKEGAERKEAAKSFGGVLGENIRLFSLITNTLAKDKATEDQWRGLERPISSRNLSNLVEDEVVDALIGSVKDSYGDLAHRYYGFKAKWFGVDKLDYWDRNAPLPEDDDRKIEWSEAKDTVLTAYNAFDGEMAQIGQRFFDENWIDVPPRAGKDSGAFAHPVTPSAHPYILLNYHGKVRDVMTLAHELGHGVHQVLAADQGPLMADTPLTLAETASVFGEMLTFRSMLDKESDEKRRRIMLAGKVEDMLNTVVRQVAFCDFERQVHDERKKGELTPDRLGEIWMSVQTESLGPAFRYEDEYKHFWAYIPHFIHSPFYVYAYAFGDCLVNSLYDVFQNGHEGFQGKYRDMLAAGGSKRHKELLAPFGLDASDPDFWKRGLNVVSGFIDDLEDVI
ncbi:Oligoendopeptidase F [Candidatus Terasakiella magnetica]|uniref:Oligoendopeptidase F n=1 Tax=Candidatus Terasakiella magnetica TaxID=1867952 RepID=A0A1C3RDN3_9PROT|nr:M3 family oligoendopeptidase [Candidatus Terasakiella magnetica]SCA55341.1 Oligoendopeptidase F [Candidatus Terasakiella magnetica]